MHVLHKTAAMPAAETLILSKESAFCKDSFDIHNAVVARAAAVLLCYKNLADPLTPGDYLNSCVRARAALKSDSTNKCNAERAVIYCR